MKWPEKPECLLPTPPAQLTQRGSFRKLYPSFSLSLESCPLGLCVNCGESSTAQLHSRDKILKAPSRTSPSRPGRSLTRNPLNHILMEVCLSTHGSPQSPLRNFNVLPLLLVPRQCFPMCSHTKLAAQSPGSFCHLWSVPSKCMPWEEKYLEKL